MACKCGAPSKGTELVMYYKKRDGTLSKYIRIEKRCQPCINKSKRPKEKRSEYIGY
jgi:hypothetical protein